MNILEYEGLVRRSGVGASHNGDTMRTLRVSLTVGAVLLLSVPACAEQSLHVNKATYGVYNAQMALRGQYCDATPNFVAACNGKEFCQLYVDPRYMCPDPAYGVGKSVVVEYSCNGQPQQSLSFPDTAQALLRCPVQ
jgi:hypothetical protein